jgi:hypothetical protein
MVPSIDDTCSYMLALGGYFIGVGGLFDANGKLLVGPG